MSELFEEWSIGSMTMRNRIVRAAIAESLCTKSGMPSKRLADVYGELAKGGVGAIITGYSYVLPDGKPSERSLNLSAEASGEQAQAYRDLADAVHGEGGRLVAQLVYGGSKSKLAPDDPRRIAGTRLYDVEVPTDAVSLPDDATDTAASPDAEPGADAAVAPASVAVEPNTTILGPSAVAHPVTGLVPTPATSADLARIAGAFGQAAVRAKDFGFDGVEVHAAHGYLLSQFLDSRYNRREDVYGGSIENRARLACECVSAVRTQVGGDFPVLVKLSSSDVRDDATGQFGLGEEESLRVGAMLVDAGASCIEVSGDWHAFAEEEVTGEPFFGSFGVRLATKLDAPVIVTGGWRDLDTIRRYLETTPISGIGMARPLICDPDLPGRFRDGLSAKTRCTSCNFCTRVLGTPCPNRPHR